MVLLASLIRLSPDEKPVSMKLKQHDLRSFPKISGSEVVLWPRTKNTGS